MNSIEQRKAKILEEIKECEQSATTLAFLIGATTTSGIFLLLNTAVQSSSNTLPDGSTFLTMTTAVLSGACAANVVHLIVGFKRMLSSAQSRPGLFKKV